MTSAMSDNPFTKRAKASSTSRARTASPFTTLAKSRSRASAQTSGWKKSTATKPAPAKFDWIEPGMHVRITWPYDPALGSGQGMFTGTVTERDEWINVRGDNKHLLYMPLFTKGIEIERV